MHASTPDASLAHPYVCAMISSRLVAVGTDGADVIVGTSGNDHLYGDAGTYGVQLDSARGTPVKVTMTCPVTVTQQVDFWPLNADISSAHHMILPDDQYELTDSITYRPAGETDVVAKRKWVEQWASSTFSGRTSSSPM